MGKRRAFLFAAAAGAIIAAPPPASAQTQYTYTATLQAQTRSAGAVTASNIVWQCQGTTCQTSGPWPQPGVGACNALARVVGRVTAYGRPGAMLNAAQLVECNQGVAGALTAGPNVRPQIQARPQIQTPPQLQRPPQQQATAPPPARGGPIRTQTLTVTGTGALAPPRPNRTVRVPTTLTVTGTGALPAPRPNRTVRVTTPLTVTGTGALSPAP